MQGVSGPAAATRPLSSPRTFPCDGCGADLEFHIGAQSLKCPFCGFDKPLEAPSGPVVERDYAATVERMRAQYSTRSGESLGEGDSAPASSSLSAAREVGCPTCGACVLFNGALTSTDCAYCGSPLQRDQVHTSGDRIRVDGVLPFSVPRAGAHKALSEWVQARWFAPNEFKRYGTNGKFAGMYFPFFTFDSMTATSYAGARGVAYRVRVGSGKHARMERRIRWTPVTGKFQYFFDDVLVCAAKVAHDKLLRRLEPWPLGGARAFDPALLAGYAAFTYDLPLEDGFGQARARMERALREQACRRIGGDAQRIVRLRATYHATTYKHLLLPAWILVYRFRGKAYQVVINAATGRVSGERPYSVWKIACAAVLVAVLVAGGYFAVQLPRSQTMSVPSTAEPSPTPIVGRFASSTRR